MRWTNQEPLKHPASKFVRGIELMAGLRYCFVAFHENEQLEPGDTLIHTFEKRNWQICETRWFYFIGTVQAEESPSASPIFKLHRTAEIITSQFGPAENTSENRAITKSTSSWNSCHDAPSGTIMDNYYDPWNLIFAGVALTASFNIYRGFIRFDTTAIPPGSQIISAKVSLFAESHMMTSSWPYRAIYITMGFQSSPIVPANYGDQLPFTTVGGQILLNEIVDNAYNDLPLNEDGLTMIDCGGITRFCIRQEMDVSDISPWLGTNWLRFRSWNAGSGQWPILTVTYVPP